MNYKLPIKKLPTTNYKLQTSAVVVFFVLLTTAAFGGASLLLSTTLPVYAIDLQVPLGDLKTFDVCTDTGDSISCDGISRYIIAGITWLMGAVGILVMVIFAWAGMLWLSARGDSKQVGQAQKLLKDGIAGLVLTLGSYTILWSINPNLVKLNPLVINKIETQELEYDEEVAPENIGTGYVGPSVSLAGFTHVKFEDIGKEGADIQNGRIDSKLVEILRAIDAAGYNVTVTSSRAGREGTASHHATGYALDISANPHSNLAPVAQFLYDNHRTQIGEMFFTDTSQPPVMDGGNRISYAHYLQMEYGGRGPGSLAKAHTNHLHIATRN